MTKKIWNHYISFSKIHCVLRIDFDWSYCIIVKICCLGSCVGWKYICKSRLQDYYSLPLWKFFSVASSYFWTSSEDVTCLDSEWLPHNISLYLYMHSPFLLMALWQVSYLGIVLLFWCPLGQDGLQIDPANLCNCWFLVLLPPLNS